MSHAAPIDPALALRWQARARAAFFATQAAFVALVDLAEPDAVPLLGWWAAIALWMAADLTLGRRADQAGSWGIVSLRAGVDLLAMSAVLLLSGGAQSPLQLFLLVEVALLSVVLPTRGAWTAASAVLVLQAGLVFLAPPIQVFDAEPHEQVSHLLGHMLAFDVAALALVGLISPLVAMTREREASWHAAEVRHAEDARLADVGRLAAGMAHALGTPLGAIELLAEEMALELAAQSDGRAAWDALRGELRRSRDILDRVLRGEQAADGVVTGLGRALQAWADTWSDSHPHVALRVAIEETLDGVTVRGSGEGWCDALWTVLDNAARAGGPLRLVAHRAGDSVQLAVEDHGGATSAASLARAGEPFYTGWQGRPGRGLGLYVARRFARAVGGDLSLAPRGDLGTTVTLELPVEGR
jgi:two-component system sensor histidine kinase RegB